MQKKLLLVELIHDLEQELLRQGYGKWSMIAYRRQWKNLIQFAKKRGEVFYSESLGIDFIEQHYHLFAKNFKHKLLASEVKKLRGIRMIGDFQLHHTISPRYHKRKQIISNPYFISISNQFKSYCENKGLYKTVIVSCVTQSERFMDFLDAQHITNFNTINIELIYSYIKSLSGYTSNTIKRYILLIRFFCIFFLKQEKYKLISSQKYQ